MEREVFAIAEMYRNVRTSVQIDGEQSNEFGVWEKVHRGSARGPLLFAGVVIGFAGDVRERGVRKLLCADGLMLLGDGRQEVEGKCA